MEKLNKMAANAAPIIVKHDFDVWVEGISVNASPLATARCAINAIHATAHLVVVFNDQHSADMEFYYEGATLESCEQHIIDDIEYTFQDKIASAEASLTLTAEQLVTLPDLLVEALREALDNPNEAQMAVAERVRKAQVMTAGDATRTLRG